MNTSKNVTTNEERKVKFSFLGLELQITKLSNHQMWVIVIFFAISVIVLLILATIQSVILLNK